MRGCGRQRVKRRRRRCGAIIAARTSACQSHILTVALMDCSGECSRHLADGAGRGGNGDLAAIIVAI